MRYGSEIEVSDLISGQPLSRRLISQPSRVKTYSRREEKLSNAKSEKKSSQEKDSNLQIRVCDQLTVTFLIDAASNPLVTKFEKCLLSYAERVWTIRAPFCELDETAARL